MPKLRLEPSGGQYVVNPQLQPFLRLQCIAEVLPAFSIAWFRVNGSGESNYTFERNQNYYSNNVLLYRIDSNRETL